MKHFAQFYRLETDAATGRQRWVEPCGDRAIIRLDGRQSLYNMKWAAVKVCRDRGFDGYQITRGDSLLRQFALHADIIPSGYQPVNAPSVSAGNIMPLSYEEDSKNVHID